MKRSLFVISDLHLGGRPASDSEPSFQMCSKTGQSRLVAFLDWLTQRHHPDRPVHLVINGDFVDFLAEQPFAPFTANEAAAKRKLTQAIKHMAEVFAALKRFASSGAELTIVIGNHDLELSLPAVRRELLAWLGRRDGSFLYDNEALTIGDVLIEHGNRYDGWNAVGHSQLSTLRAAASRREPLPNFTAPAGSRLVVEVMNEIKRSFPWIDLIKPENEAAIPLLATLAPQYWPRIGTVASLYATTAWPVRGAEGGEHLAPAAGMDIGRALADGTTRGPRRGMAVPLSALSGPGMADDVSAEASAALGSVAMVREAMALGQVLVDAATACSARDDATSAERAAHAEFTTRGEAALRSGIPLTIERTKLLLRALRYLTGRQPRYHDLDWEKPDYLEPAQASALRGFSTVIFGHTHLMRRVSLDRGARYFNSGTWADVLLLPRSITLDSEEAAFVELYELLSQAQQGDLSRFRSTLPSYVCVEISGGGDGNSDLYQYCEQGPKCVPGHASMWELP